MRNAILFFTVLFIGVWAFAFRSVTLPVSSIGTVSARDWTRTPVSPVTPFTIRWNEMLASSGWYYSSWINQGFLELAQSGDIFFPHYIYNSFLFNIYIRCLRNLKLPKSIFLVIFWNTCTSDIFMIVFWRLWSWYVLAIHVRKPSVRGALFASRLIHWCKCLELNTPMIPWFSF
jgi:hypothetical protein